MVRVPIFQFLGVAFDYQWIVDPALNADRGPVSVFGLRLHVDM